MIQSVLFFSLGFLCAFLLALMVAPAIWRRAVALTRKRLEAAMPMSMGSIRADHDQLRAEFAMSSRKLETEAKASREKAAEASVENSRHREEIKRLEADRKDKQTRIDELEQRRAALDADLDRRGSELTTLEARLTDALSKFDGLREEFDVLESRFGSETMKTSNLQVELVARETQIEKLNGDVSILRTERKEADRRVREVLADNKAAQEALRNERRRAGELEKKIERMLTDLSDREERLERREKELARLKDENRLVAERDRGAEDEIARLNAENARLDAELSGMSEQVAALVGDKADASLDEAVRKLRQDRRRLEERLTLLTRENNQLRAAVASAGAAEAGGDAKGNAVLREQLSELAAEIVHLTSLVDQPDSPIRKMLDAESSDRADGETPSLADRIRALRKAASYPLDGKE